MFSSGEYIYFILIVYQSVLQVMVESWSGAFMNAFSSSQNVHIYEVCSSSIYFLEMWLANDVVG